MNQLKSSKRYLYLDVESASSIFKPMAKGFYLTVGHFIPSWGDPPLTIWWDHNHVQPTPGGTRLVQEYVNKCDVFCGQNVKFDLNVLSFYGVDFSSKIPYCTMVAEYLLEGQNVRDHDFDLNTIAAKYGVQPKLDVVKSYWEQGVDTCEVPSDILEEYVIDDTRKVQLIHQLQDPKLDSLRRVFDVQMEFMLVLSEIELNGFKFDTAKAYEFKDNFAKDVQAYTEKLLSYSEDKRLNLGSPQQLSAFLFGGIAKVQWSEWVIKEGKSVPYSKYYEKIYTEDVKLNGLGFIPDPRTETAVKGYYSTDKKNVLTQLVCKTKEQREVKKLLLELSNAQKAMETLLGSTDGSGLINKILDDGRIHPNYNQAVTKTGRLSSNDPNGTNLPRKGTSPIKQCIITEY